MYLTYYVRYLEWKEKINLTLFFLKTTSNIIFLYALSFPFNYVMLIYSVESEGVFYYVRRILLNFFVSVNGDHFVMIIFKFCGRMIWFVLVKTKLQVIPKAYVLPSSAKKSKSNNIHIPSTCSLNLNPPVTEDFPIDRKIIKIIEETYNLKCRITFC